MERRVEQRVEGLARFRIHDVAAVLQFVDVDAVEERLVADASERVVNVHVDRIHVTGERQAVVKVLLGLVVLDLAGVDARIEERESAGDAVLFLFEKIEWYGPGVMGVQEAPPFVAEFVPLDGEGVPFGLAGRVEVIELAGEHMPQRGDDVLGNLHALVVVLDLLFDVVDRHGLAGAGRPLGVAASAHEVRVDVAVPVLGVGHHEPGAAVPAVDRALQVVLVGLGLLAGDLVGGEDILHPVPDFGADQWLLEPVIAGASEDHVALVVRIGEHVLDRRQARRLRGPLRRRHGRQPAVDQLAVQHRGRVVPGRVRLERPPHQRGTVGVRDHRRNIAAEFVALVDVEIADGRAAHGPAGRGLLRHALGDLVGEVAGVELRDRGHDAVQQHPGRGLVNVLRRRNEHDPGLFEREVDRHVVGAVASETVNLVDDAVSDRVRLDVLDHPHQFGPVGLARGLARVHELLHDDRVEVAGFSEVRIALGRDGEAFVASTTLGLLLGGDAEVGDGECRSLAESVETGRRCWGRQSHESCFLSPMVGASTTDGAVARCDS